jgi:hypothetical protein
VETALVETALVETALVETALVETALVAPGYAVTSCICVKIKKSNVLHYICHFTSDKNNFLVLVAVFRPHLGRK